MIRRFSPLLLLLCLTCPAFAQDRREARDRRSLDRAANNGRPLQTETSVPDQVTAQAVLIPRVDARRIFGAEIANNYAVIEVNVGNKSSDAALIIHGIFIDYSRWALSGTPHQQPNMVDGILRTRAEPFQASTIPSQVASEEYRVVRGQLLDAQMWTRRNWVMRLLTFAGSLAGAYAFSLNEEGIIRGLNAFSGVAVPGFREVWPDGTIEQLNRISDFGYQANKVIPRQGAEVIVCFFPIDRFLTPGFKKLFLHSPALFFSPLQMLVDKKLSKEADVILSGIDPELKTKDLNKLLPCYLHIVNKLRFRSAADGAKKDKKADDEENFAEQINQGMDATCYGEFGIPEKAGNAVDKTKFKMFMALDFISQMSLNNVSVKIDGVMTIDTMNIAAKIDEVKFDDVADCGDDNPLCFWADPAAGGGVRTGTLSGAYMTGGEVMIAEANDLGITEVDTTAEGSNDQKLRFSFKLTKAVPPDTKLHVSVTKTQSGSPGTSLKTINSLAREYRVGYTLSPPRIEIVSREADTLTVNGSGFFDLPDNALAVEMLPPGGGDAVEVPRSSVQVSHNQLVFPVPENARSLGCWKVVVKVGVFSSPPQNAGCQ